MTELTWQFYPVEGLPDNVTGGFGEDYGGYLHRGTDVGVYNVPVIAPQSGLVVGMVNDGSFGIAVCIQHEDTGWYSCYAHLSRQYAHPGDYVSAGAEIGVSGDTGYSSGPHLHWQVCDSPSFPADISHSRDAMKVPFSTGNEDEMGMTKEQEAWVQSIANKVAVLEAIVAGNGIDTDGDGKPDLFGIDAVDWAYDPAHGWSAFALAQKTDMRIAVHEVEHIGVDGVAITRASPELELTDPSGGRVPHPPND